MKAPEIKLTINIDEHLATTSDKQKQ